MAWRRRLAPGTAKMSRGSPGAGHGAIWSASGCRRGPSGAGTTAIPGKLILPVWHLEVMDIAYTKVPNRVGQNRSHKKIPVCQNNAISPWKKSVR